MGRGRLRGGTGRPEDVLVDIPETRYAPTPDGGYIAYKVIREGPIDVGHVNAMATNLESVARVTGSTPSRDRETAGGQHS